MAVNDFFCYQIEVRGALDEAELNANSPYRISLLNADSVSSRFTVLADQSGLIGFLRHMQARGIVLLALQAQPLVPAEPPADDD